MYVVFSSVREGFCGNMEGRKGGEWGERAGEEGEERGGKRGRKTSTGFLQLSLQSRNCSHIGTHTHTSCSNFDVATLSVFNMGVGLA